MVEMKRTELRYIPYVCAQCGAEDTGKYYAEEQTAPAFNCHRCHAGSGLDVGSMLQSRQGMFPVLTVEPVVPVH